MFTAPWCGPCKLVARELARVAATRPSLRVLSFDIAAPENVALATELGIKALPLVAFCGARAAAAGAGRALLLLRGAPCCARPRWHWEGARPRLQACQGTAHVEACGVH